MATTDSAAATAAGLRAYFAARFRARIKSGALAGLALAVDPAAFSAAHRFTAAADNESADAADTGARCIGATAGTHPAHSRLDELSTAGATIGADDLVEVPAVQPARPAEA